MRIKEQKTRLTLQEPDDDDDDDEQLSSTVLSDFVMCWRFRKCEKSEAFKIAG